VLKILIRGLDVGYGDVVGLGEIYFDANALGKFPAVEAKNMELGAHAQDFEAMLYPKFIGWLWIDADEEGAVSERTVA
jgi:hypothetical protein